MSISCCCSVLLLLLLTSCHGTNARTVCTTIPSSASSPRSAAVTDGLVDIGGLSLHIHCVGNGDPVVVLEAGLGNDGSVWNDVGRGIGRFARACATDRAGMGYSSGPAPRPHTHRQMARELHAVLVRAGLVGPYVLVGHSMGGINVRFFASEHPAEVAGMVLVDATQDPLRTWSLMPNAELAERKEGLRKLPEGLDFETFVAGAAEMRASSQSIGDKPLVVLTRGKEDAPSPGHPELSTNMLRTWQELQADLPRLSTNSVQIVATNSRHYIQWDAPNLVVAAVREVVEAARTHGHVNSGRLSPLASEGPIEP